MAIVIALARMTRPASCPVMRRVLIGKVADAVVAVTLLAAVRGPRPNASLGALRSLLSFGARVLIANLLSVVSRNADNILVGRYLGTFLGYRARQVLLN